MDEDVVAAVGVARNEIVAVADPRHDVAVGRQRLLGAALRRILDVAGLHVHVLGSAGEPIVDVDVRAPVGIQVGRGAEESDEAAVGGGGAARRTGEEVAVAVRLEAARPDAHPLRRVVRRGGFRGAEEDEPVRHREAPPVHAGRAVDRTVERRRHLGVPEADDAEDRVGTVAVAVDVAPLLLRFRLEERDDVSLDRHRREAEGRLLDADDGAPVGRAGDAASGFRADRLGLARVAVAEGDDRVDLVAVLVEVLERDAFVHYEVEGLRGLDEALERHGNGRFECEVHAWAVGSAVGGAGGVRRLLADPVRRRPAWQDDRTGAGDGRQAEERVAAAARAVRRGHAGAARVRAAAALAPCEAEDRVRRVRRAEELRHPGCRRQVHLRHEDRRQEPALGGVRGEERLRRRGDRADGRPDRRAHEAWHRDALIGHEDAAPVYRRQEVAVASRAARSSFTDAVQGASA